MGAAAPGARGSGGVRPYAGQPLSPHGAVPPLAQGQGAARLHLCAARGRATPRAGGDLCQGLANADRARAASHAIDDDLPRAIDVGRADEHADAARHWALKARPEDSWRAVGLDSGIDSLTLERRLRALGVEDRGIARKQHEALWFY